MCSQSCPHPPTTKKENYLPHVPPIASSYHEVNLQLGLGLLAALEPLAEEDGEDSGSNCTSWLANKRDHFLCRLQQIDRERGGLSFFTYRQRQWQRRP